MHTSGLVITLADDPALAVAAERALIAAGPFTLGEAQGACRAVVLETDNPKAAHDWHERAETIPGVIGVEVVFVHWDESALEAHDANA